MAKSQQSFAKKEKEKKRRKKKQEKMERRMQRKAEREEEGKKTFEDMLAYVDENGNLSDVPPDPKNKKEFKVEDISLDASFREEAPDDGTRQGKVKFFNEEKGYGFIVDKKNHDSIFVHANDLEPGLSIRQNEHVTFEIEVGAKGAKAVNVKLAV